MNLTKKELVLIRDNLLEHWLSEDTSEEPMGSIFDKIEAMLKTPPREFWISYDVQAERWRVQETPFECDDVRPGMQIHHAQVMDTERVGEK